MLHVAVAILGAGLTGLRTAQQLERRGIDYRLYEKGGEVGGHVVTCEENGYRFDRTGHLLHLRSDALREEVLDWLEGECCEVERRSLVFSHGVLTRYPFQANTFGLPPEVAYECLLGFVKAHFAPKGAEPQNFEAFCRLHFGDGISRHFMLPYNARLWGVPPDQITSEWCQRFVPLPKLEDVLAGAVGRHAPELGYNTRFLYPRRGIGALPSALARGLPGLVLGRAPLAIRAEARELIFADERVGYQRLVSSAPLPNLLACFDALPPEVNDARRALRCTHLYYLDVALSAPAPLDAHWVYVPEAKYPFYRVGCYSHFSPDMAPAGAAGLYVELAGREPPDLSTLLPEVVQGLLELGWIRAPADVAFARLRRLDHAYVIYDHAYRAALSVIHPFLESVGVLSTGRYGAWNYSSMEDALNFGSDAAAWAACDTTPAR